MADAANIPNPSNKVSRLLQKFKSKNDIQEYMSTTCK